jgi:pyruvate formate lyase activating enzyme
MIEIGGLQKTTLIDYPGRLAATVFLIGCNFRCPFCYSAELVLPEKIKNQPRVSQKDFFSFLKERKGLLEGVVICGGEPCLNQDLPAFIKKIKKLGYLVKLDTNGSNPKMLEKLIKEKLVDYVAMDIKAPKEKYMKVCGKGVNVDDIEKSIEILKQGKVDYEFRTTVVPNIHIKEDIIKIAKWLSPAKKYYLQNFRPEKTINPKFEKLKPHPKEFLLEIKKEIYRFFDICEVR